MSGLGVCTVVVCVEPVNPKNFLTQSNGLIYQAPKADLACDTDAGRQSPGASDRTFIRSGAVFADKHLPTPTSSGQ